MQVRVRGTAHWMNDGVDTGPGEARECAMRCLKKSLRNCWRRELAPVGWVLTACVARLGKGRPSVSSQYLVWAHVAHRNSELGQ